MPDDIRSALVTGAASGIGRALVTRLVAEGVSVVAVDIDEKALRLLADDLEVQAECVDVADRAANEALADRVGAPDLLS